MAHTVPPVSQPICEKFIVYDTAQWPLVHATVKSMPNLSMTHFRAHLHCFAELLSRDTPFYILFDLREASLIPMDFVSEQAEFMKEQQPNIARNLISSAIVSDSWFIRSGLDILFAIKKPTRPNKTFTEMHEAVAWMQSIPSTSLSVQAAPRKKFFFEP